VLTGVLVGLLIELPEQLLEDRPHLVVGDGMGMEVYPAELLDGLVEEALLLKLVYRVANPEAFEHLPHLVGEAVYVGSEVRADVLGILQQAGEGELGDVPVEMPGGLAERSTEVVQAALEAFVPVEDPVLRGLEDAVLPFGAR
jgi:hypothetical protein